MPLKIRENQAFRRLNGSDINLLQISLSEFFSQSRVIVEIIGIGGSGKTSLACLIAGWLLRTSLASNKPSLPLLFRPGSGVDIYSWIKREVMTITALDDIPDEFIRNLLKTGRILILADGISEASKEEKQALLRPNVVIGRMLITMRSEVGDSAGEKISILLDPIDSSDNRIFFLTQYFAARGAVFKDSDYQVLVKRLSRITGDKSVTPALLKLFSEHAMKLFEASGARGLDNIPATFPDLLRDYVVLLVGSSAVAFPFEDHLICEGIQILARHSLDESWRPIGTNRAHAVRLLTDPYQWSQDKAELLIKLLVNSGLAYAEGSYISLWLDPATEYFAAMNIVEMNGRSEAKWADFLQHFEENHDILDSIGFLAALYDVAYSDTVIGIPTPIVDRIGRLSGRGQPEVAIILQQLIRDVFDEDTLVRQRAPYKLREFGDIGKTVIISVLRRAKRYDSSRHWEYALRFLSALGEYSSDHVDDIRPLLSHDNPRVRQMAARALGFIDAFGVSIPDLCECLADLEPKVRFSATKAISEIGIADSEQTIRRLSDTLNDSVPFVHWHAAQVLSALGEVERIIDVLSSIAVDSSALVRSQVIRTLGMVTRTYLADVIQRMRDKDAEVQVRAISGLREALDKVAPIIVTLIEDTSQRVRRRARVERNAMFLLIHEAMKVLRASLLSAPGSDLKKEATFALSSCSLALLTWRDSRIQSEKARVRLQEISHEARILERVITSLQIAAVDSNPEVREGANRSMAIVAERIVEQVGNAMTDSNLGIRRMAAKNLMALTEGMTNWRYH
ncbi:MAG: hypothetical protein GY847_09355 [Proteobacteria bacterium]|nr:hypothetical protein [Pseudomonadota bacterium]